MAGLEQYQGMSLQQALSPQMQQSLNILQAPITELRQLVSAELAENPVLEDIHQEGDVVESPERDTPEGLDDEWQEYYAQKATAEPWTTEALERRQHFLDSQTRPPTLLEFLGTQIECEGFGGKERAAADVILGNLDENGYFRGEIEEAAYPVGLTVAEAEAVLESIQQWDPPGVAARDLRECLLIQLRRNGHGDSLAAGVVSDHLEELGRRKLAEIARAMGVTSSDIQDAAEKIRELEPRPGHFFARDENQIITADVVVERGDDGEYSVRLNDVDLPQLRISNDYKDMIGLGGQGKDVRNFLREKIRSGRFLMKCIEQRNQTLLAITREIVSLQKEFLDLGTSAMRPMTMSHIASAVGVHETTVSRAVSGKYMVCPQGIFELKFFFTSGYTAEDGTMVSNEGVRQSIADFIKNEDSAKPLSDQHLVKMLAEQGITVARRTIAKYREQLGILPSHLRKRF